MSTKTKSPLSPTAIARDLQIAVVRTEWNSHITKELEHGCIETLETAGISKDMIDTFVVPGAVELTFAANSLIEKGLYNSVIVLGCVIRGGTPHFDYVCQSVTQGITHLNAECDIPVIFGVLTVDNEQDAIDRAGGKLGNKGAECAEAALMMYDFVEEVNNI